LNKLTISIKLATQ